jgi:hypothetical protein
MKVKDCSHSGFLADFPPGRAIWLDFWVVKEVSLVDAVTRDMSCEACFELVMRI